VIPATTQLLFTSAPPVIDVADPNSFGSGQWNALGFDEISGTGGLDEGDVTKGAAVAAPLFYLFAGFVSFCTTLSVVGSTSYAARTYRKRKEGYEGRGWPEPEPDDHYIVRDGPPEDFPFDRRPSDDFFEDDDYPDYDDEYEDEEYADDGEEVWMVEEDEPVPEINLSTWQAMPDEEIAELPMSSNVARMQFYTDDDDTLGQSFYPTVGGFPGALAMKDDDYIEAAGGDFDDFGPLRDMARRQGSPPHQTGGISMFGAGLSSAVGVGGMISSAFGDPFAVGDLGDGIDQPHITSNPFEGRRDEGGHLIGPEQDYADDPFDEVPVMDDDNYIVLEL